MEWMIATILLALVVVFMISYIIRQEIRRRRQDEAHVKQIGLQESRYLALLKEHEALTERSKELFIDPVTELPTFKVFTEQFHHIFNESQRYAFQVGICLIEVTNLQAAIDEEISEKNAFLRDVAKQLKTVIRQVDLLSYYQGNIFALIINGLNQADKASLVAHRIFDVLSKPSFANYATTAKRISIGIAIYPTDGNNQNTVFSHALHALSVAKQKGRSTYQFYEASLHQLSLREHAMQQAVLDEHLFERLVLQFYPIYPIGDSEVLALAAKLCWPDALATVTSDEWIRIAALQNRLVPIMIWQLEQACKQFLTRGAHFKKVRYLVVALPVQLLKNTRFVHGLSQWLIKWHFDPKQLWLQVYGDFNTIPLEDFEKAANMLKYLNVGLIVDQRGDQVLPFHYFLNSPFTYYHLTDKIFNDHMDSARVQSMLRAVSLFMNQLSIQLIVSGVYTEEQLALLKQFGVSLVLDQSETLTIVSVADTA